MDVNIEKRHIVAQWVDSFGKLKVNIVDDFISYDIEIFRKKRKETYCCTTGRTRKVKSSES